MTHSPNRRIALASSLASGLALFALGRDVFAATPAAKAAPVRQGGSLAQIRKSGVLRVGVLAQAPWAMVDSAGRWMGFDVELAERLAQDLGVRAEMQRVSWASAADEVAQGSVDLVPGLWPGPRRALVVNFSASYASVQVVLLANRAKASALQTLEDFNRADISLGVLERGLSEQVARERLPKATLVPFADPGQQLLALQEGRIHALISRTPAPELLMKLDAQRITSPLTEPLARRSEAFAIRQHDVDFLAYLDAWVRFQRENGWLGQRRAYWFEGVDWQNRL